MFFVISFTQISLEINFITAVVGFLRGQEISQNSENTIASFYTIIWSEN